VRRAQLVGEFLDRRFSLLQESEDADPGGLGKGVQPFGNGKQVPYIVAGNGGYHNLHRFAKGTNPGEELAAGVTFEYGDDRRYGFLKLTIDGQTGKGEYIAVKPGEMPDGSEAQVYPAEDSFTF
jgi:hypothetical protein